MSNKNIALVIGHCDVWRVISCNTIARYLADMDIVPVFIYSTSTEQWVQKYPILQESRYFKETWFNQDLVPFLDRKREERVTKELPEMLTPAHLAEVYSPKPAQYVPIWKKGGQRIHEIGMSLEEQGYNITCVISADTYAIISKATLDRWPTIGVHPAPLPQFPDLFGTAKQAADNLRYGETVYTATIHKLHEILDHGQIVARPEYDGAGNTSLFDIRRRLYAAGVKAMMEDVVPKLIQDGDFRNIPLEEQNREAIGERPKFRTNMDIDYLRRHGFHTYDHNRDAPLVAGLFTPPDMPLSYPGYPHHEPRKHASDNIHEALFEERKDWVTAVCKRNGIEPPTEWNPEPSNILW